MFKNIVPNLVSFETTLEKINGFYYSDNFQFYPKIEKKSVFHYKIFIDNNINIPQKYDFRNGYFTKLGNKWFYKREVGIFTLKFCFDPQSKTFSFNKLYFLIPFEIGKIFPVGLHIADFINLDLFLSGITTIRGCAFNYKGNNTCVIGPSMNGKTSLVSDILKRGGKYIAEDILIMNFKVNKIYPTTSIKNFNRSTNKTVKALLINHKVVLTPVDIGEMFLIQNSTNEKCKIVKKEIFDYLNLNSLLFLQNHIVKSYIFEEKLTNEIFEKLTKLKSLNLKMIYEFKSIKNFNFDFFK